MMATYDADVVIIGAGLSGCALAAHLARENLRVIILHPGANLPTNGGEVLKQGAIAELTILEALPSLMKRGTLKRSVIHYHHDGDPFIEFNYQNTRNGHFLLAPYQSIVEAVAECATQNGAEIWFSAQPASVTSTIEAVSSISLRDGRDISAWAFVCTDQKGSPLSRWIGPADQRVAPPHTLWTAIGPPFPGVDQNSMYFSSRGWFAYFYPLPLSTRAFIGTPVDAEISDPATHLEEIRSFVSAQDARTAGLIGADFRSIPLRSGMCAPYHRGNVTLLGSAAWTAHPMTGQGMSHSLRDARVLASCIARSADDPRMLESLITEDYEPRRALHRGVVAYGDALASSYPHRERYLQTFDWRMHGDISEDPALGVSGDLGG